MSEEDKANLFALTFTQNDRCMDHTSMAGHALGIKQYCHSPMFASGVFTFNLLASSVLVPGQAGADNACALADGIIMDDYFVLRKLDASGKVTNENLLDLNKSQVLSVFETIGIDRAKQLFQSIDLNNYENKELTTDQKNQVRNVLSALSSGIDDTKINTMLANAKVSINSIQIFLGDSTGSNSMVVNSIMEFPPDLEGIPLSIPIPLTGAWQTYRCPMGASCTLDNECGICANSAVEYNYSSEYSNAICEHGKLVNKTPTSSEQQSPQNGN